MSLLCPRACIFHILAGAAYVAAKYGNAAFLGGSLETRSSGLERSGLAARALAWYRHLLA
jgi:hypothetical protein